MYCNYSRDSLKVYLLAAFSLAGTVAFFSLSNSRSPDELSASSLNISTLPIPIFRIPSVAIVALPS